MTWLTRTSSRRQEWNIWYMAPDDGKPMYWRTSARSRNATSITPVMLDVVSISTLACLPNIIIIIISSSSSSSSSSREYNNIPTKLCNQIEDVKQFLAPQTFFNPNPSFVATVLDRYGKGGNKYLWVFGPKSQKFRQTFVLCNLAPCQISWRLVQQVNSAGQKISKLARDYHLPADNHW